MIDLRCRGRAACNVVSASGETICMQGDWVEGYFVGPDFIVGEVIEADDECASLEFWVPVLVDTVVLLSSCF